MPVRRHIQFTSNMLVVPDRSLLSDRSLLLCTWGARGACALPIPGREAFQVEPTSDATVPIVEYEEDPLLHPGRLVWALMTKERKGTVPFLATVRPPLLLWGRRNVGFRGSGGAHILKDTMMMMLTSQTRSGSAIGAGDTFIAGALYGLLCRTDDWDLNRVVRFAVDLATIKIQQDGFQGLVSQCRLLLQDGQG